MQRRAFISGLVALTALAIAPRAWAGSYLDRAALLLDSSRKDADALRARMTDKELARVVQAVADARQQAASDMDVPAAVAKAHPHLLLSLKKVERAAQAAIDGSYRVALEHLDASRREEGVFRSALSELGHPLPKRAREHDVR